MGSSAIEYQRKRRKLILDAFKQQETDAKPFIEDLQDEDKDFDIEDHEQKLIEERRKRLKNHRPAVQTVVIQDPIQAAPEPSESLDKSFIEEAIPDMFAQVNDNAHVGFLESALVLQNPGSSLIDNWDDEDGYYKILMGEILNNRYHVCNNLGRGVFSSVVKAKDLNIQDRIVAIKIIRNNELMYVKYNSRRIAGLGESKILEKLRENDPNDTKHVVSYFESFDHKNHFCLVFESLKYFYFDRSLNLRQVLEKYGKGVGLSIKAVRSYAYQLLLSLQLLKDCEIVHLDIKPDNILVNEDLNLLKLADFGSAREISSLEQSPYLASRFYRAPEIILGAPIDYAADVWSVGVTIYEMYTGQVLFPGRNNNEMLKLMMQLKGRIPTKLLKKGACSSDHFDHQFNFKSREIDSFKSSVVVRNMEINQTWNLGTKLSDDEPLIRQFVDFLEKLLEINPSKRLKVADALQHPFIKLGS